jgi:predicted phosphodiesterase
MNRETYVDVGLTFVDMSDSASDTVDVRFISDTHDTHNDLRVVPVDAIIHCGDETSSRDLYVNANKAAEFFKWFGKYPAKRKIYVPGNHSLAVRDGMFDRVSLAYLDIDMLVDRSLTLFGHKVYGSPHTPLFGSCAAYMMKRGRLDLAWQQIPKDTDILLTHGPPKGIRDLAIDYEGDGKNLVQVGCSALRKHVENRVQPLIHAFGHIHDIGEEVDNYGALSLGSTLFVNAACVSLRGVFKHQGIVVRLPALGDL